MRAPEKSHAPSARAPRACQSRSGLVWNAQADAREARQHLGVEVGHLVQIVQEHDGEAAEAGRFDASDTLLLSGFGAGMSWASAVLTWGRP